MALEPDETLAPPLHAASTPAAPIGARAIRGSVYGVGGAAVTLTLGFTRSVLLARLLLPEHFGVVTLALFYVSLATQLRSFGLDQALVHRRDADETVRRTYFALRVLSGALGVVVIMAAAPALAHLYPAMPLLGWVLLALAAVDALRVFSGVQETMLSKDLAFAQLAAIDVVASATMTVVAPLLAWSGWGVWALVAEQGSGFAARAVMAWLAFRRWPARWGWDGPTARWFWEYGKPTWGTSNLSFLATRFDDFWIGSTLGGVRLGFYSRAYAFAHYPRRVVVNPLVDVLTPVFAHLQADRLRLSQAFYRATYVILRGGFLVTGIFALVMPEFIHLVIGDQWRPMLVTFRLMLVYTLLDALHLNAMNLLLAVGRPRQAQRTMAVRTLVFIPGVILGAQLWDIDGVALAADAMAVAGGILLCRYLWEVVDFSLFSLAFWPALAIGVAWSGGMLLESASRGQGAWALAAEKIAVFGALYVGLLLAAERAQAVQGIRWAWAQVRPRAAPGA
jgi:O-antigen/teichoic acid export membrane protein